MFADLFPSGRGRPSVPADVVATVMVLQALHGLSDRRDGGRGDVRSAVEGGVRAAGHRRPAFHPTTLTYWRRRLAASEPPNRIFDAVTAVIAADRGADREDPAGVGLHDPGRRGRHPGHGDPVDRGDPPGPPRGARRRRGRRRGQCTAHDYDEPGKPDDRLGRRGRPATSAGRRVWSVTRHRAARAPARAGARARSRGGGGVVGVDRRAGRRTRRAAPMAPTGGGGSPSGSPRTG